MIDTEKLVAINAVRFTRGRSNAGAYYDDLLQVGRIALWKARAALASTDAAFVAYAAARIVRRAMRQFMRSFFGWSSGRVVSEEPALTAPPRKRRRDMSKKERAATPVRLPETHTDGGHARYRTNDNDPGSDSLVWMFIPSHEDVGGKVELSVMAARVRSVALEVLTADQLRAFDDESYKPQQRYVAFAKVERRCREVWGA